MVCMGSNVNGCFYLEKAREALKLQFLQTEFGEAIETEAEGNITQPNYWNQAARFTTPSDAQKVIEILKKIEKNNCRTENSKKEGKVTLDIDLLTFDEEVLKPADMHKSFVRKALESLPVPHDKKAKQ